MKEAAIKLAEDFSIIYDSRGRASPKESIRARLAQIKDSRQEERDCYLALCDYLHSLHEWKVLFGTLFDADFVELNEVNFCLYLMVFPPYLEVKASLKRLKALTSKYGGNEK